MAAVITKIRKRAWNSDGLKRQGLNGVSLNQKSVQRGIKTRVRRILDMLEKLAEKED